MKTTIKLWLIFVSILINLHLAAVAAESWEYLMDFQKPKNADEQAAWDLLKACRHQGDKGASRLIAEMPRLPDKFRNHAFEVLSLTGSTNAQEYFLSLAITGNNQAIQTQGANLYVDSTKDALSAQKLLKSDNRAVRIIGLRAMSQAGGFVIKQPIWQDIQYVLASDSARDRELGAVLTGRDSGTEVSAATKAEALIQSLSGLEALPGADKLIGLSFTGLKCCSVEISSLVFLDALRRTSSLEVEFLQMNTPKRPGPVRDCILLVRSFKGDATADEDLRSIVLENASAPMRWKALEVYGQVGTTNDLPILEAVAREDPAIVKNWTPHIRRAPEDDIPRDHYPLREMATNVIATIQKRSGGK